jgi:hypothetical protein
MISVRLWMIDLAVSLVAGGAGIGAAWWMRRYTLLSARNLYPAGAAGVLGIVTAALLRWRAGELVLLPLAVPWVAAASAAHRWRQSDLGAGEELRAHELSRRWIWTPRLDLPEGERRFLGSQGELVHERRWPEALGYVSMSAERERGARLPLGAGQHVVIFGATGAGKTTTARRLVAARTLSQRSALLVLDQKGDANDVHQMHALAAAAGVPFILFDSQDPRTDRWQPLWGTPDGVAARAVEPIKQSEPYYYDVLRRHLDIVCRVLYAADRWPPSIPMLVDACQPVRYPAIHAIAKGLGGDYRALARRAREHSRYVASKRGTDDLTGGAFRLEVALALASRQMVTPRQTPHGEAVAVGLIEALRQRAVVMWRTHADTMPDEAAALSVLALADLHDAAEQANAPWTLLLDEFGAVIKMAAQRAMAILQRGRSHGGQVVVITQSAADIEALTGQSGLLASLTDNFAGVVAHRQTAPESRDWLAKLMGTRALWQQTQATSANRHSGRGSARRVREFRIGADVFSNLGRGEAVLYTPVAGNPRRASMLPFVLPNDAAARIDPAGERHPCEVAVHPEEYVLDRAPVHAPTAGTGELNTSDVIEQADPNAY